MKLSRFNDFLSDNFTLFTCILSAIISVLYVGLGFEDGFNTGVWLILSINVLYIPCVLIFTKKSFPYFYMVYSLILVFILAFEKTFLFNNFSALFILSIVILYNQKLELPGYILYFISTTIAFVLNEESLVHYLSHIARSLWFIQILTVTIHRTYTRKKLILYDDEKEILRQLSNGKVYQKEVIGFSENTIYRKLKSARERNGNITRDELVELFREEMMKDLI